MRRWMVALFLLGAAAGGWGETLALTIHNEKAYPGLAGTAWTVEYFVDDQGRLAKARWRFEPSFTDEAPKVILQDYHWETDRVWWVEERNGAKTRNQYRFDQEGEILAEVQTLGQEGSNTNQKWSIHWRMSPEVTWESDRYRARWSESRGFSKALIPSLGSSVETIACLTEGAKMTFWTNGNEQDRIILDRSPRALIGHWVTMTESLDGWITIGQMRLSGPGLWVSAPAVRFVHALLVSEELAVPFIFEEKYLR